MATSGSTDFTINGNQIVKGAMRLLGDVLSAGEEPSVDELNDGREALNLMIKSWQAEGIGLWKNNEVALFLEKSERTYSLGPTGDHCTSSYVKTEMATAAIADAATIYVDAVSGMTDGDFIGIELDDGTLYWTTISGTPTGGTTNSIVLTTGIDSASAIDNHVYTYTTKIARPVELIEARIHREDGTETDLTPLSRSDYMIIPNKTNTGSANQYYFDKQTTNVKLSVWPATDRVDEWIMMTVRVPFDDFDDPTDNADFPIELLRTLKYNLAIEIAPEFDKEPSPTVLGIAAETMLALQVNDAEQVSMFLGAEEESGSIFFGAY